MNSEKRLKHIIQKYPEIVYSLTTPLARKQCHTTTPSKLDRMVHRSLERMSRYRFCRRPLGRLLRQIVSETLSCVICTRAFHTPVTLECGDTFCKDCLEEKVSSTCPICGRFAAVDNAKCNVLLQDVVHRLVGNFEDQTPSLTESKNQIPHKYILRSQSNISNVQENETLKLPVKRKYCDRISISEDSELKDSADKEEENLITDCVAAKKPRLDQTEASQTLSTIDVECILCGRCLYEPVTTSCGHTFCRACLARVLDYGLACPLCMSALEGTGVASIGVCHALEKVIRELLPLAYKERVDGYMKEIRGVDEDEQIPVFICTSAFPSVACPLHVYEPRYRLLTRRCLQTSRRRFAMAASAQANEKFADFGTVLEVKDAVNLQDGTSILTTVGLKRFRVISRGEKDGYDTAKIHYIHDQPPPGHVIPLLHHLHDRVHRKAIAWFHSLTEQIQAEVEQSLGTMPPLEYNWITLPDGPAWTWWLMPVLPLSAQLQVGFLSTTSLEKRLRAIDKLLERIKDRMKEGSRQVGCVTTTSSASGGVEVTEGESCAVEDTRNVVREHAMEF